jgi:hypothetical protein
MEKKEVSNVQKMESQVALAAIGTVPSRADARARNKHNTQKLQEYHYRHGI